MSSSHCSNNKVAPLPYVDGSGAFAGDKKKATARDDSFEMAWFRRAGKGGTRMQKVRYFARVTTSHGFIRVMEDAPALRRAFWILLTLTATAIFVWTSATLFNEYLSYPTITSISIQAEKDLPFPDFTVCNLSPIKRSALPGSRFLTPGLQQLYTASGNSFENFSMANWTTVSDILQSRPPAVGEADVYFTSGPNFVHHCSFDGIECTSNNFTEFLNLEYGRCFRFSPSSDMRVSKIGSARSAQKLSLTLFVDEINYIPSLGDTAGVRGFVHHRDRLPIPENDGFSVGTGQRAWVGLRQSKIVRLPPPYGDCGEPPAFLHSMGIDECKQALVFEATKSVCGCTNQYLEIFSEVQPVDNTTNCNDDVDWECAGNVFSDLNDTPSAFDECRVECEETNYLTSLSTATWPSNSVSAVIRKETIDRYVQAGSNRSVMESRITHTYFRENFARIELFYEELNYQEIKEAEAVSLTSLFAQIGGNLGLYLGMSALTIFEFIELIIVLVARS